MVNVIRTSITSTGCIRQSLTRQRLKLVTVRRRNVSVRKWHETRTRSKQYEIVAQLVEHRPFKPRVAGSIPADLTMPNDYKDRLPEIIKVWSENPGMSVYDATRSCTPFEDGTTGLVDLTNKADALLREMIKDTLQHLT